MVFTPVVLLVVNEVCAGEKGGNCSHHQMRNGTSLEITVSHDLSSCLKHCLTAKRLQRSHENEIPRCCLDEANLNAPESLAETRTPIYLLICSDTLKGTGNKISISLTLPIVLFM